MGLDLHSDMVVGWSMHYSQGRKMVLRAVEMTIWQREGNDSVILYLDRGQFTSGDDQRYLKHHRPISSISAVDHCADNTAHGGFFGMVKPEVISRL